MLLSSPMLLTMGCLQIFLAVCDLISQNAFVINLILTDPCYKSNTFSLLRFNCYETLLGGFVCVPWVYIVSH